MNIRIHSNANTTSTSTSDNTSPKKIIKIGTHNGLFHCDEVVACSLLIILFELLLGEDAEIIIVRTRDKKELSKCDICVDVGEGKLDHHYKGFNQGRNGVKYASAGLVFKYFGRNIIEKLLKHTLKTFSAKYTIINDNISIKISPIDLLVQQIDNEIIKPVDMQDNGDSRSSEHYFDFIPLFNPSWHEKQNLSKFNENFEIVFSHTVDILKKYLTKTIFNDIRKNYIAEKSDIVSPKASDNSSTVSYENAEELGIVSPKAFDNSIIVNRENAEKSNIVSPQVADNSSTVSHENAEESSIVSHQVAEKSVIQKQKNEDKSVLKDTINSKKIIEEYLPQAISNIKNILEDIDDLDTIIGNEKDPDSSGLSEYVKNGIEFFIDTHDFSLFSDKQKELILVQKIHTLIDDFYSKKLIEHTISNTEIESHTILQIPCQTINWKLAICDFNEQNKDSSKSIDFVIFPYPAGGYALQCVPKSLKEEFSKRIELPKKDKLPAGITKLHPGLFFATGDYNALIALANEAIELYNKENQPLEGINR